MATEIVCVLRYRYHAIAATGSASESVKAGVRASMRREEEQHLIWLAERINQLGGKPNLNPEGCSRAADSEYVEGENLVEMIKENLVAERIAVETYRDMIRYFARQGSDDARAAGEGPGAGRGARQRHARPPRRPRGDADLGALKSVRERCDQLQQDARVIFGAKPACAEHGRSPILRDGVFAKVRPAARRRSRRWCLRPRLG